MTILAVFLAVVAAILICVGVVIFSKKPAPAPYTKPPAYDSDETIFMTKW